jgi:hypothetical protein
MKKKTTRASSAKRNPRRRTTKEKKLTSRINNTFSEEMENYGDLEDLSEEELTYHDQLDDDYDEEDDAEAGREGIHSSITGSTNNSRFGGKQQYASKGKTKKSQGGDGQSGYFWKRPKK